MYRIPPPIRAFFRSDEEYRRAKNEYLKSEKQYEAFIILEIGTVASLCIGLLCFAVWFSFGWFGLLRFLLGSFCIGGLYYFAFKWLEKRL